MGRLTAVKTTSFFHRIRLLWYSFLQSFKSSLGKKKQTTNLFEWGIFNVVVVRIDTSGASCVSSPVLNDFREFRKLMMYENTQMSFLETAPVPEMNTSQELLQINCQLERCKRERGF